MVKNIFLFYYYVNPLRGRELILRFIAEMAFTLFLTWEQLNFTYLLFSILNSNVYYSDSNAFYEIILEIDFKESIFMKFFFITQTLVRAITLKLKSNLKLTSKEFIARDSHLKFSTSLWAKRCWRNRFGWGSSLSLLYSHYFQLFTALRKSLPKELKHFLQKKLKEVNLIVSQTLSLTHKVFELSLVEIII